MSNIDDLIRKGYRIYKVDMIPKSEMKNYFKTRLGLFIDYHEGLKVILVRSANSEDRR